MRCSRQIYEVISPNVLKQALLRSEMAKINTKRRALWSRVLEIDLKKVEFDF
jgi:hypothetical protein